MTDAELDAITERASDVERGAWFKDGSGNRARNVACDMVAAVAEVRRLRDLVKEVEYQGAEEYAVHASCPWCGYMTTLDTKRKHSPDCPAFTEAGEVR